MKLDTLTINVGLATEIGLEESIILGHFRYWTNINATNPDMTKEGRVWLYASRKSILNMFPFLSDRVIRTATAHLEEGGWILKGESSTSKGTWYALSDASLALFDGDTDTLVNLTKTLVKKTNDIKDNKKEYTIEEKQAILREKCERYVEQYGRPMVEAFLNYWSQVNGNEILCEIAKRKAGAFDVGRRLATWAQNEAKRAPVQKPQPAQKPAKPKVTPWEELHLSYEDYVKLNNGQL